MHTATSAPLAVGHTHNRGAVPSSTWYNSDRCSVATGNTFHDREISNQLITAIPKYNERIVLSIRSLSS